ncbi:DUF4402 domain-containing protein [Phenylobacterium sp.]|uniref:DUF4402 domain-containing protein n=1 Tax=Phenylobacterium sp. TaxID=1871053 RepID=UPI0035B22FAF
MTIRRHLLGIAIAAAALAAAGQACAQTSQSATGSITVMQPVLNVTKTSDLSFGSVFRPSSGSGSISIDANTGAVNASNLSQLNGNTTSRAGFTVEGQPNANIYVTYPNSVNLTRSGGSETLTVYLTSSMGGGQISGGGTVTFNIGGQVTLSSSTVLGAYSNSFTVTVAYN